MGINRRLPYSRVQLARSGGEDLALLEQHLVLEKHGVGGGERPRQLPGAQDDGELALGPKLMVKPIPKGPRLQVQDAVGVAARGGRLTRVHGPGRDDEDVPSRRGVPAPLQLKARGAGKDLCHCPGIMDVRYIPMAKERRVQRLHPGEAPGPEEGGMFAWAVLHGAIASKTCRSPDARTDAVDRIQILRTGEPDEVREFALGRLELYRVGAIQIGRAIYEPGWRWSEHVRPVAGTHLCEIGHVGLVVSGSAAVRMANGEEIIMTPGDFFAIPGGHDSWVIGDERYVSLHLLGADAYAAPTTPADGAPDLEAAS